MDGTKMLSCIWTLLDHWNNFAFLAHLEALYNKDGVRKSVHNYHYIKNSVRQFPQSSMQNFMRNRPLFLHSSTWYLGFRILYGRHSASSIFLLSWSFWYSVLLRHYICIYFAADVFPLCWKDLICLFKW